MQVIFIGQSGSTTIAPAAMATYTKGSAASTTLVATGGVAPYTWSISAGAMPAGMALNSGTGVISGTPTTPGPYNFTVRSVDAVATATTKNYSGVIHGVVVISPTSITFQQTVAMSQTLTPSGGVAAYTFALTAGALPAGIAFNAATGVVSGTPTTLAAYSFTIQATDSQGDSVSDVYSGTVASAVTAPVTSTFAAGNLANGGVGVSNVSLSPHATNAPTSYAIVSAGGSGATISGSNLVVPAATADGNYTVTWTATNAAGVSNTSSLTFTQQRGIGGTVSVGAINITYITENNPTIPPIGTFVVAPGATFGPSQDSLLATYPGFVEVFSPSYGTWTYDYYVGSQSIAVDQGGPGPWDKTYPDLVWRRLS